MITYRSQTHPPHVFVELEGTITGDEVRKKLKSLPTDLESLPDGFVALAVFPELVLLRSAAIGSLFYYLAHIFDVNPGLVVFVDGGQNPHPGLRSFIDQIGLDDQVRFVRTREQANREIEQYVQTGGEPPS